MNPSGCLLDTGFLVAFLDKDDKYHQKTLELVDRFSPPFRTCESVISETCFLASKMGASAVQEVIELGSQGFYEISLRLDEHWSSLTRFLEKYHDRSVSLADACLVLCAELHEEPRILTFDSDFEVYRWGRNRKFQVFR